ncbi:MAG TPA: helix-turn-helix transcriptional regulator, partial [Candidatus Paenibacillus intestinavium]|nr:helix-turn-helix transcriptional regulator [Candidatus Paenibacillus intestinavium]
NFEQSSLSLPLAKCLMFDLISTMLKTIEDMSSINQFIVSLQTDSVDILMNCRTVNEMKVQLIQVLRQVCELIERGRKQDNQLVDQIIQYVNEQYSSENLNISMIGEHFELTPSYLSRQFRDQTGEALLSFINKIRLREAKRLLAEQTMTINDISKNVGYGDINTFHRIFKKSEGITPGKYRELL